MNKNAKEYIDLLDEIELEMVFDVDFFTNATKKEKERLEAEMCELGNSLIEKVEESKVPKEQKVELIELINQRMEYPEIG